MPLYEYECEKCRERTEVVQRFSDAPLTVCESCGGALRKLISSPAIQFKGSGFYITDYPKAGSSGSKSEGSKSEGSKSEGSKSEGSKSEGSKTDGSKSEGSKSEGSSSSSGSDSVKTETKEKAGAGKSGTKSES